MPGSRGSGGSPVGPAETEKLAGKPRTGAGRVLVVLGRGLDLDFPLPETGVVDIGRSAENAVRIDDPSVSRRHARLHLGARLAVEDVGAVNPVRVRGQALARGEPADIAPGEVIEIGALLAVVRSAAEQLAEAPARPAPAGLVVASPATSRLVALVERIAVGDVPVLILGETGVGKEMIAETIHRASPRAAGPFVRINCAALPATLLESELFGHEKGAFTGAERAQVGLLESAGGGTVFLDEIGDMPLGLQATLLRVLEDRAVTPVGGRRPRPIDVRFVSATNRDLRVEVDRGGFRRDLYYRLNGISFTVPPLRERRDEIVPLAEHFAARARPGGTAAIGRAAAERLLAHPWPGNVRELRHAIEAAVLLAGDGPIEVDHLPAELSAAGAPASGGAGSPAPAGPAPLRDQLADVERQRIIDALRATDGNQTRAAELLGMPRRTLVKRLRDYDIPRGRRVPDDDRGR